MSTGDSVILKYQQKCHREYVHSIDLPKPYTYPDGNPIRPLPPVRTTSGGLMIVGAYPSARFEYRRSDSNLRRNRLIPVADNLQPFGYEQYFDGVRVRTLESANGLQEYLLAPLGLTIDMCWVTDLVKVFLYKPDHVDSCADVKPHFKAPELRTQFRELARRSLPWLKEECVLCHPRLIVTLGEEVAQVVSEQPQASADQLLLQEVTRPATLSGYPTLFLPHPDACRRSEKWRAIMKERVKVVRKLLREV